jgi:acetyltransferase-like isoleucine patch superfamily enzyme
MLNQIRILFKKVILFFLNTVEETENVKLSGFSRGLQNVDFTGQNAVPDGCNFSGKIKIGYATTLGVNNFIHGNISIGKYCQFGADVAIHTTNHPIHYLSSYINKNLFSGELKKLKENKETFIGNDVWIGHNALIIGGVTIGNGAIIAAGTVVTKNVEPYSIVAGVPSKVLKKRFTNEVIQEIEKLEWWHKTPEELDKIKPFFFKNFNNRKSIYEE